MVVIFYLCDNSLDLNPTDFINKTDIDIVAEIAKLKEEEVREYDFGTFGGATPINNASDFQKEYNSDLCDNEWFCQIVQISSYEYVERKYPRK